MLPLISEIYHSLLKTIVYILACCGLAKCDLIVLQHYPGLPSSLVQVPAPSDKMVVRIQGDLILGGLFSLHRRYFDQECFKYTSSRNVMRVEAMLYAIEEINNDTNILPNITLGAEIRDDCLSSTIALEESLNFVLNAFGQGGKICADPNAPTPVMGVVGTVSSQTAISVASLLRLFRLPQVSYGATSPDLDNRDEYEYFVRTVPSDERQAKAMLDIIRQLAWSAVFVISSSGNYGERIREKFVGLAARANICIAGELKIVARKDEETLDDLNVEAWIENFMEKINERTTVRGVVLLTERVHTLALLQTLKDKGIRPGRFHWIASDTWGTGIDLHSLEDIASGAITIALHNPRPASLKQFYDHFRDLKPGGNSKNLWFDMFWERHFSCAVSNDSSNAGKFPPCTGKESYRAKDKILKDDKVPYVFDSVYAFAQALDAMMKTTNASLSLRERLDILAKNEINLLEYLMNTSFTGISGNVSFDRNGDGLPRYDVMSYANRSYTKIAVWDDGRFTSRDATWFEERTKSINSSSYCSQQCKVGEGRFNYGDDPKCCWECQPCSSKQYVDIDIRCRSCAVDQRPNRSRTGCERLPTDGPSKTIVILLTFWCSLGLIVTTFVAFTMYKFYSTPLIMATGRELMLVLLVGIALSFLLGFTLLGNPSARRCALQRFGSGVFFAVCYSAILVKTNRVARIFSGRHTPAFITPGPQLLITALLVSIQVGISAVASFFDMTSKVMELYEPKHLHMVCRTTGTEYVISISYNVLLLILCTVHAFLTRKLPENFNEAKLVGITMYTTCVQWICFLPLFYGTRQIYRTTVLLLNSCFSATVLLVGMFGQKVYVVWLRPERNTRQASNPRGRMGSTSSVSGNAINMNDDMNGNMAFD